MPPVIPVMICCSWAAVSSGVGGGSGTVVDLDAMVFLLVGVTSVSSDSSDSSESSDTGLVVRDCCIECVRASPNAAKLISPSVRSIS